MRRPFYPGHGSPSQYQIPGAFIPEQYPRQMAVAYPPGGMGQHPQDHGELPPALAAMYTYIPAFYTVTVNLPPDLTGMPVAGSTPLRPEPFLCKRVTWATTGDTPNFVSSPGGNTGSAQGRAVAVQWEDEFTKFLGSQPTLLSAIFGDSQGFLDIPSGVLFQGKQTMQASLIRLLWPDPETEPATVRFDIVFHGLGLLPKGVHQSGSAG